MPHHFATRLALAGALLGAAAAPAAAQNPPEVEDGTVINVDGAPLGDLIEIVARRTNKVFLFAERVKAVKIYSKGSRKIPNESRYDFFQSSLELNQFALATIGKGTPAEIVKVVDARNMRRYSSQSIGADEIKSGKVTLPTGEEVVTVTYNLRWSAAREVSNALRPLLDPNQGGQIIGIDKVEVLVMTDYAPNIKRLLRVIELMDQPGPQLEYEVIPLRFADPDDLVGKIGQFMEGQLQAGNAAQGPQQPRVRLVSYPRTGSIIVQAIREHLTQVKELIGRLDVELAVEPSRIHIRKLKHTQAEEMAETVNAILQARPTLSSGGAEPATPAGPGRPTGPRSPGRQQPTSQPRRRQSGGSLGGSEDDAVAIADITTNSLIVVAAESEWREIARIVDELDVRRPQVLIEAAIIEVTSQNSWNVGAELATIDNAAQDSTRGFAATQFGLSNLVDANGTPVTPETPGIPAGRIPALDTQGIVIGLTRDTSFQIPLLLNLFASDSTTNVMALPHILTNDNEEGSFSAGDSVPTAQLQNVGQAGLAPISSFQGFEEAGLEMTVTPHISEGNYLNLELNLSIDQFTGSSSDPTLPPPKATRRLTNRITVPNHQTVIIGGLTSQRVLESTTKIPLLGDIPLLGMLFRRKDVRETNTHLYVFLTPHILDDDKFRDLGKVSKEHLRRMREDGVDPAKIDQEYRAAFADDTWPGAAQGLTAARPTYQSLKD
jgi:general secretion pathway protein D